jgi:hypothetical protein
VADTEKLGSMGYDWARAQSIRTGFGEFRRISAEKKEVLNTA